MLIAHATADLSSDDVGFVHAAALAAAIGGERRLLTLHVPDGRPPMARRPDLKRWLTRWGRADDSVSHAVYVTDSYEDPADGVLDACRTTRPDLLVLPTHARTGLSRVLVGSIAEAVARNLSIPTLLLPLDGHGLVDSHTGEIQLERMLVLGGSQQDAQRGVDAAGWISRELGHPEARMVMLHIYDGTPFPEAHAPNLHVQHRAGELTDTVTLVCAELQPQLIVMVSRGHDQARDVLLANRTERVLRAGHRPLLWVPPTFVPSQHANGAARAAGDRPLTAL
jgi:nucleotide-binding universal stress UspA family protein